MLFYSNKLERLARADAAGDGPRLDSARGFARTSPGSASLTCPIGLAQWAPAFFPHIDGLIERESSGRRHRAALLPHFLMVTLIALVRFGETALTHRRVDVSTLQIHGDLTGVRRTRRGPSAQIQFRQCRMFAVLRRMPDPKISLNH